MGEEATDLKRPRLVAAQWYSMCLGCSGPLGSISGIQKFYRRHINQLACMELMWYQLDGSVFKNRHN